MLRTHFYRVIEEHIEKKPNSNWFKKETMKFFNCTLPTYAYLKVNDLYFITGEKAPFTTKRFYTIRKMDNEGEIHTIGEFNNLTRPKARKQLASILECYVKDL